MVEVLAHRGASRAARENTIEAFRLAAELGSDAVELDVHATNLDDATALEPDLEPPDPALEREREIIPPGRGGRRSA